MHESHDEIPRKETTVKRSVVYGSVATPIKKPDSDHTHRWTVYIRGAHNEDISTYIKRVTFRLHESFPNPSRTIENAPFEVTETGWGEFQLNIRVVFQDVNQKPINLTHHLKLYPTSEEATQLKTSRPVVSEHYEELIFDPPTETLAALLKRESQYLDLKTSPRYSEFEQMEKEEIKKISSAIDLVKNQITETQRKISQVKANSTPLPAAVDSVNISTSQKLRKK